MSSGAVADASGGFAMFGGDDRTSARIGYLRIRATDNVMHRAGTAVRGPGSFLGAGDAVTATFKGDFSNHTFKVYPMMECTGEASDATLNRDKDELKVVLANTGEGEGDGVTTDATATPQTKKTVVLALCMEVAKDNTVPLPNTDYTATVKYMKLANATFPRAERDAHHRQHRARRHDGAHSLPDHVRGLQPADRALEPGRCRSQVHDHVQA